MFPSPCGVRVVSWMPLPGAPEEGEFPSPCGVWVVSRWTTGRTTRRLRFRPLAGCGLFQPEQIDLSSL